MSNHIEQPEAKSQAQAKNDTHSALLDDSIGKPFSLKAAGETQPADTTQSSIEHKINLASLSSITTKDNTANVAPLLQYDSKMTFSEKALRVGQVSAEGLVYSVPGALHAVEHDLSPANWKETGIKILSAGAMGAAMRVALPESGAVKAIVGTAMAVYFMKDAAKPVISAWGDVTSKRGDDVMTRAAQNMGDGIGAFAVDSYLSAKVAGFTGKMTPILAEKYVPGQWSALEGWKTAHMGPSSTIGLELTSALDYADSKFKSLSDRLNPPKLGISELSREQILSSLADSKEAGARADYSEKVYSHGLTGSDGNAHGLDGTVDLLLQGKDPRTVPGGTAESEIPGKSTNKTGFTQLDGWSKNKDGLYVPDYINQAEAAHQSLNIDIDTADARARGTSSPRGRGSSKGTLRGDAAATTDTTPKTPGPTNPAEKVLNAETMGKVAGVIKAQLASVDDTTSIIRDRVNRETTAVHVATDPDYKTMDPAYLQARNAMVDLANQVGDDPKNFMQVDPLFKRLGDATTQAHAADLGPEGQHVARMNTYTKENQTTYVHNMIKEGIDPEKALAQKPLAPLVELSDDQSPVGVDPKTGKVVTAHEGPHTVRAIYGPNGEPIWPIDLIKNPIREMGVRGYLTSGIYGHEEFHDQFGQLGKLDPEVRDAHLMGAAQKALGADADVKIDIPHATPTELAAQQVELKGALEVLAEALKRAKGEKGAGIASAGEGKGLTIDPDDIAARLDALRGKRGPKGGSTPTGGGDAAPKGGTAPKTGGDAGPSAEEIARAMAIFKKAQIEPLPAQMPMKEVMVDIAKAWADETFADWGAASESGQTAAPYFQALRKGGQLYNGTVMSEDMRGPENPLGIEVHPVDKLRPRFMAGLIRKMATAGDGKDQMLLDYADALDKYSRAAGKPGDIVLASTDHPGQKITIPEAAFDKIIPELVNVQLETPLPKLQGKTLFDILPDLGKNMHRNEDLSNLWVDAIKNGKAPETVPFDKTTLRMTNVYGTGQPALLKLIADGMDPMKAAESVNQFSDFFGNKFLDGDPHVDPIKTPFLTQLKLAPTSTVGRIPKLISNEAGRLVAQQAEVRQWVGDHSIPLSGAGGSLMLQDLLNMRRKNDEIQKGN